MSFDQREQGSPVSRTDRNRNPASRRRQRQAQESQVVNVEDCGRVVGKVVAPTGGEIFGPWRGAVYLTRN